MLLLLLILHCLHGLVVGLAHGEDGHGEVEAAPEEDDDGVEADGGGQAEQDVEQRPRTPRRTGPRPPAPGSVPPRSEPDGGR